MTGVCTPCILEIMNTNEIAAAGHEPRRRHVLPRRPSVKWCPYHSRLPGEAMVVNVTSEAKAAMIRAMLRGVRMTAGQRRAVSRLRYREGRRHAE